jgi:CcmD family protein
MNNLGYLFAAYTFVWLAVSAYVYSIARRQETLAREIEALRKGLQKERGKSD